MVHTIEISAILLLVVHVAVIKSHGILGPLPPYPPLPPPHPGRFYTQNWSGVARDLDGVPRGVFSGASAGTTGNAQAVGAAFSLDSATNGDCDDHSGGGGERVVKDSSYQYQNAGSKNFGAERNIQNTYQKTPTLLEQNPKLNQNYGGVATGQQNLNGFRSSNDQYKLYHESQWHNQQENGRANVAQASSQAYQSQNQRDHSSDIGQQQQLKLNNFGPPNRQNYHGASSYTKENQFQSKDTGVVDNNVHQQDLNDHSSNGFYQTSQGQNQFKNNNLGYDGHQQNDDNLGASHARSSYESDEATYGKNNRYHSGSAIQGQKENQVFQGNSQQSIQELQQQRAVSSSTAQAGRGNGQNDQDGSLIYGAGGAEAELGLGSTLHRALDLASQGLSASQQASNACTTCGKSSLALSNAKSKTGSAIALSING